MSRLDRKGLEFFPMNVDFFDDDKIAFVNVRHGEFGELIAIKLLCKIYKQNGYFYSWSDDEALLFAKRTVRDEGKLDAINNVVAELCERDFFDKQIFEKYKVLTSRGIQKRYEKICKDSKRNYEIEEKFRLIPEIFQKIPETFGKIPENSGKIPPKVKESKVKQTKENKIKENKSNQKEENCLTDFSFIFSCKDKEVNLSKIEVDNLIQKFPKTDVIKYLNSLSEYCNSGGEKIPYANNLMNVIEKGLAKKSNDDEPVRRNPYPMVY